MTQLNVSEIGRSIATRVLPSINLPSSVVDNLGLNPEVGNVVTERLGLPDYYTAHVLTYCKGDFRPNGTSPDVSKNLTTCSNRTAMLDFDPAKIIESELPAGITLADLNWPSSVDTGIDALRAAFKTMFIAFIVGIIATALTLLTSAAGLFDARRLPAVISFLLALVCRASRYMPVFSLTCCQLSFLALGIASGIATAVAVKATDIINREGARIGVSASRGSKFLAMTWSATALMFLAAIVWMCLLCVRPRRKVVV